MDFGLSEDQEQLGATIAAFLKDHVPISKVRELRKAPCPNDRAIWRTMAELGVNGVLIPEHCGGSQLRLLDAVVVAQALGFAATPLAFLSSAVMFPTAMTTLGEGAGDELLAQVSTGECQVSVAVTEYFSLREGAGITLQDGKLTGKVLMALDACGADFHLVAMGGDRLALLRGEAVGLKITRLTTVDATRCTAELEFEGVTPECIFEDGGQAITRMLDAGRITLAADLLGACESMIQQSVAYAGQRKQFGRLIGSFQAVKHMCAEMVAELEPARSLLWYAAHCFDALPTEASLMACHVLAHISEIGSEIASVATQVHGGIGWTDEQNLHFWFKRIGLGRQLLGGPELLRQQAAELQGLVNAA